MLPGVFFVPKMLYSNSDMNIKELLGKQKKFNPRWELIIPILILGGWLYWFQLRPSEIRKSCINTAKEWVKSERGVTNDSFNSKYRLCLTEQGMKPEDLLSR